LHDESTALNKIDFSYKDESRPGKPLLSLGPALSRFLSKDPFASARIIAAHFGVAHDSVKMIRAREFGLKQFSRRWLLDQLNGAHKKSQVEFSRDLLQMLEHNREL
jgi:hypothetical protein